MFTLISVPCYRCPISLANTFQTISFLNPTKKYIKYLNHSGDYARARQTDRQTEGRGLERKREKKEGQGRVCDKEREREKKEIRETERRNEGEKKETGNKEMRERNEKNERKKIKK